MQQIKTLMQQHRGKIFSQCDPVTDKVPNLDFFMRFGKESATIDFPQRNIYIPIELVERPWLNLIRRANCPAIFIEKLLMTDKCKNLQEDSRSESLEKEVQKEADSLWESGVLGADAIEKIGKEHWRTPYPKKYEHFGEEFSDSPKPNN